jgi:hypothetical protein
MRNGGMMKALSIIVCGFVASVLATSPVAAQQVPPDEAYAISKDAYVFCFPLNYYYRTVYAQIIDADNKRSLGGFGKWRHDGLATPSDTETTMPNNDTPYSWAWVDLRSEPWVLVQPAADGTRFYSSVWGDLWAHIIDYPGSVLDGQQGGVYLLAPTSWKGEVPKGIKRVIRGETTIFGTLTRTAVFSEKDLPNMKTIQNGYQLMPLSTYLKQPAPTAAASPTWPAWKEEFLTGPETFTLANFLMQFVVPHELDKPLYERMAKLGIGPKGKYDPAKLSPEVLAAINRGIADGRKEIIDGAKKAVDSTASGPKTPQAPTWMAPNSNTPLRFPRDSFRQCVSSGVSRCTTSRHACSWKIRSIGIRLATAPRV